MKLKNDSVWLYRLALKEHDARINYPDAEFASVFTLHMQVTFRLFEFNLRCHTGTFVRCRAGGLYLHCERCDTKAVSQNVGSIQQKETALSCWRCR